MDVFAIGFENPWIKAADTARRPLPAWLTSLLGLIAAAVFVSGGQALAGMLTAGLFPSGAAGFGESLATLVIFYGCVFGPFLLMAFGMVRLVERRGSPFGWAPARAGGSGLAIGAAGFGAVVSGTALLGFLTWGSGAPTGTAALGGVVAALLLIGFQAGAEEVFFRGWIQPRLCARWGAWIGLAATAALFACAHLFGSHVGMAAAVNLFLGGLMFSLIALRTGGLWAPFAAHLAWNWGEAAVFGLDPNPGLFPLGALFDFDLRGPGPWSGGGDGLNGSLVTSLVLSAIVATLAAFGPLRGRERA